jgi:hypothetical protein
VRNYYLGECFAGKWARGFVWVEDGPGRAIVPRSRRSVLRAYESRAKFDGNGLDGDGHQDLNRSQNLATVLVWVGCYRIRTK